MVEDFAVREIKCSLEVVTVSTDHPPKIKLGICIRVREITVYKLYIEHARTSMVLTFLLFIESFTLTW
jgi:hypothetical protein